MFPYRRPQKIAACVKGAGPPQLPSLSAPAALAPRDGRRFPLDVCLEHDWFVIGAVGRLQDLPHPPERSH
jgi:hypothetical protein